MDLVAQDVLLCSCVNLIGRWGEVASDPQAPLQSHDDQAGDDNVCPSLTSSRSGLSSRHQFSLSSSARSAVSGSLQSPVKCVGCAVLSGSIMSDSATPWMVCSLPGSSVLGDSPGKDTGVGSLSLLQGIFPTQGSNPGLLHCRQILHHLSHQGSLCWIKSA